MLCLRGRSTLLRRTRGTYDHRRSRMAATGLQQYVGLCRLRHRICPARAAAVQLQQPAGGLPELRGFWQYHRRRHGPCRARPEQVAPRRGDRALERAGLCPRAGRVADPGPGLRSADRRAVLEIDRRPAKADPARRGGAGVRRAGRFFRLAGAAEVQDARPRVLSRWRSYRPCPACGGARLRTEALDARIGGRNIAHITAMQISEAADFFYALDSALPALTPCPSPRLSRTTGGRGKSWHRRLFPSTTAASAA